MTVVSEHVSDKDHQQDDGLSNEDFFQIAD